MSRVVQVTPRHTIMLDEAFSDLFDHPPAHDHVVRTLSVKKVNDQPMVQGELVIAGQDTLESYPRARDYPLHFRKTYYPICFFQDPAGEFSRHTRVSEILDDVPPPIGSTRTSFRSCFFPGKPLNTISPFGKQPDSSNIAPALELALPAAIGHWYILSLLYADLLKLHAAGLAHGDAELHNFIVTPAPVGITMIDFEKAVSREEGDSDEAWDTACAKDLPELLKEAVYLMCFLGRQPCALGEAAWDRIPELFDEPGRFTRAIERQTSR